MYIWRDHFSMLCTAVTRTQSEEEIQRDLDKSSPFSSCWTIFSESYAWQYIRSRWLQFDGAEMLRYRKWPHLLLTVVLSIVFCLMVNVSLDVVSRADYDKRVHHAWSGKDGKDVSVKSLGPFTLGTTSMWVCGIIVAFQVIEWLLSLLVLLETADRVGISDLWVHYISTGFVFAMVYFFMELSTEELSSPTTPTLTPTPNQLATTNPKPNF